MPLALGTALTIGGTVGKTLLGFRRPPKKTYQQSPEEKAYFETLGTRSREGIYGKTGLFSRQSRVTSVASNQARKSEIAREGSALARGTQGVSSREAQKVGDTQLLDILARSASEGEDLNELSKIKAQDELGRLGIAKSERETAIRHENAMAKYGAQQAGLSGLFGGMSDIGGMLPESNVSSTDFQSMISRDVSTWTIEDKGLMRQYLQANPDQFEGFYNNGGSLDMLTTLTGQ